MTERALTQQVTDLVRKLFWRHKSMAPKEADPDGSAARRRLRTTQVPDPIIAGRLQLIGLGRVKENLGDRWPRLADRVRSIAQTIIERNLLPGDVYEADGEDGFLTLFAQLSPSDSRFKCQAICRQIEERLIGCNLTEVSACTFEVVSVDPGEPSIRDDGEHLSGKMRAATRTGRLTRGTMSNAPPPAKPVRGADASLDDIASDAEPGSATPKRAERESAEANNNSAALDSRQSIQWMYRPVWDFKQSALMMFALLPSRPSGMRDEALSMDKEGLYECDSAAVAKSDSDLGVLSNSGRRLPILVQVHNKTIANARRRALLFGKIKSIPDERRKLISLEIVDCPSDGLTLGLTSFVSAIRGCGMRIGIRVHCDWKDFRAIERCGIKTATMNVSSSAPSEAALIEEFERFADRTDSVKLESAIWGLGTRSLAVAAASSGIRYLAGDAIAPEMQTLSHALRFTPVDLYSQEGRTVTPRPFDSSRAPVAR